MNPVTIRYDVRPQRRSLASAQVADLFGLSNEPEPYLVADGVELDVRLGDLVLFTGPSGSGKSSLMREIGRQLGAVDVNALLLPELPIIDALPGEVEQRMELLSSCGLGEARLLLRTPGELSDGQRARFRIALALATGNSLWFQVDEFAAVLDRTLAKVLAANLRKLCWKRSIGFLTATTHDDLLEDLNPDLHVDCRGDGEIHQHRRDVKKKRISLANDLWISEGARSDWPYFARWHYRNHRLAFVKRVVLLWHGVDPIGICVFSTPAASLTLRSRYFGLVNPRCETALAALNSQLWVLSRVVLHPTYRGAGIAAAFVRKACRTCPIDWVETLSVMGRVNPFFERAGFTRVGIVRKQGRGTRQGAFGRRASGSENFATIYSEPAYFIFDNRPAG